MKKILLFFATVLAVAQAQATAPDTVIVIEQPKQVIITETPSCSKVQVIAVDELEREYTYNYDFEHAPNDSVHVQQSRDYELKFPFQKSFSSDNDSTRSHWTIFTNGLYLGGGSCSLPEVRTSSEIGLLNVAGIEYDTHHGQQFSFGVGLNFKRYFLKDKFRFVRDFMTYSNHNTEIIGIGYYPEGIEKDRNSQLELLSIQFPLLYRQHIYKRLKLLIGGIMNWNVNAVCVTNYQSSPSHNEKVVYDIHLKGLEQQKLTFDAFGGLSIGLVGIYFRYSPQEFFKKGFGPEIKNSWTAGVSLFL